MSTKVATEPTKEESPVAGLRGYLEGVRKELKLAEWPTRPELIRLTQVVLTLIAIVAVYCGGLDWLLGLVTNRLFNR
jgi:preprotein translocase SecE subunit